MKKFSKRITILSVVLVTIFAVGILGPRSIIQAAQQVYNKWMILTLIIDKIERFYVDEKDPDELLQNAITGMLSGLDPHSVYLTAEEYAEWKKNFQGYRGIGLRYQRFNQKLIVVSLIQDGPAERSGIQIGDRICKIQGKSVADLENGEIQKLLLGSDSTSVQLLIERNDVQSIFIVPREKIHIKSIPCVCMLDDTTGYIKIAQFVESTPKELDAAFSQLLVQGMNQLILDLRDNGGGALRAGIGVADRFIPAGKLIAFTKGRAPSANEQYIATRQNTLPLLPLIVMVNKSTASDAEIVAGAIQDWDRGLIVGQPTYGKALVQTEYPFQDGSALLLTTARYFTPLGRLIQRDYYGNKQESSPQKAPRKFKTPSGRFVYGGGGITPDIIIKDLQPEPSDIFKQLYFHPKNFFFKFADEFVRHHEGTWKNPDDFIHQFAVSDSLLNEFYKSVVQAGYHIFPKDFMSCKRDIRFTLWREIAGRYWGEEGRYLINVMADEQIRQSRKYFKKARELFSLTSKFQTFSRNG